MQQKQPQALADPSMAPGTLKSTFVATTDLKPLPMHLVTELSHLQEVEVRLEIHFQKLQVLHTALQHTAPMLM